MRNLPIPNSHYCADGAWGRGIDARAVGGAAVAARQRGSPIPTIGARPSPRSAGAAVVYHRCAAVCYLRLTAERTPRWSLLGRRLSRPTWWTRRRQRYRPRGGGGGVPTRTVAAVGAAGRCKVPRSAPRTCRPLCRPQWHHRLARCPLHQSAPPERLVPVADSANCGSATGTISGPGLRRTDLNAATFE